MSWTYALTVQAVGALAAEPSKGPVSTLIPTPGLTDDRRAVLVALAAGYLRPHPHYDPRPQACDAVAERLGVTTSQVMQDIDEVRTRLVAAGVDGLDAAGDTRQLLCDWLAATRMISPRDLGLLAPRAAAAGRRAAERSPAWGPSTSEFAQSTPGRIHVSCLRAPRAVAPRLQARLAAVHGKDWLTEVNADRKRNGLRAVQSLDDHRACLALLAHDRACRGWVSREVRRAAMALKDLTDAAAHGRPLASDAAEQAQQQAETLRAWSTSPSDRCT